MQKTDFALVQETLNGDNRAYEALMRRFEKPLLAFCTRTLGNAEDAADAAQEAFVKAYYALPRFRRESPFAPWLYRIAGNACMDAGRRRRRAPDSLDEISAAGAEPADMGDSPEESAILHEQQQRLREAVHALPERHQMAIMLYYFGQLGVREIGEAIGCSEGTVKSLLFYGREKLRARLESLVRDELQEDKGEAGSCPAG